jgi:magnesium transporter
MSAVEKLKRNIFGPRIFALFLPEIKELLESKNFNQLKELLKTIPSIDLSEGWIYLEPQEKIVVFKLLSFKKAVEVFEDLRFFEQQFLLNNLENIEIAPLLNEMSPDERAQLFKDLPSKVVKKLFSVMRKEEVDDVKRLLTFEEGTAGALMNTEFVELKKDMTARRAILRVQESQKVGQTKTIYSVYVTDDQHHLIGGLTLQELITAPPDILIKDIMGDMSAIKIDVNTTQEEVAKTFTRYDLLDAPVVDQENRLVGIITIDDVVDLIHKETTKEIYEIGKMGTRGGEEIRYQRATVLELVRRRAGWLILLLLLHIFSGWILKNFEYALGTVVALAFFIPMLLDTGGNAGAQTSITIIRSLATGDASFKNIWHIAKLEIMSSFVLCLIVGVTAFLRAFWLENSLILSLVVGITMMVIVLVAILTGMILPFLSKRMGLDPAALAGPITTTVVDVIGLIIYFKVAQLFLPVLK